MSNYAKHKLFANIKYFLKIIINFDGKFYNYFQRERSLSLAHEPELLGANPIGI